MTRYWVVGLLVAVSLHAPGCSRRADVPVDRLRHAFQTATNEDPRSKNAWFSREQAIIKCLSDSPQEQDNALQYLLTNPPDDETNFVGTLQCALLNVLIDRGDTDLLLTLLTHEPIETNNPDGFYLEFALVNPYVPQPIDRIVILFDAYERTTLPDVRTSLAASIRRAFCDRVKPEWPDAQVVERCRFEFNRDKARLKANQEWRMAYSPGFFNITNVVPPPLFIPKDGPDAVKEQMLPP